MKPNPWSYSALDTHENCPKQYHHKYVLKDLPPEEKSPEQEWGTYIHKQFEYYLTRPGFELPHDLVIHKSYLDTLDAAGQAGGNKIFAERKVALGRNPFGVCDYFDKGRVWWRGVIDVTILEIEEQRAKIADFKTGKKFDKWDQLAMNAVWVFFAYPDIQLINAQFYWTVDQTVSKKVWARGEIDQLIEMFSPKLHRYINSFQTDTWTPRESGLCGWCPVKSCQFWRDRKERRR
jgi:hypothetical protein